MPLSLNKTEKKILFVSLAMIAWLVFARKGLRLTTGDKKARKKFSRIGVRLHTETKSVDGHMIHYTWTGNRSLPVLFFIHGSPKSWTFFEKYLHDDLLLERFRILSVDRPGFGQSDFGKAERIPVQAEILCNLLDSLSTEQPVYVVGHSLGAAVAVSMAARRPGKIKGIVLAGGALDPSKETTGAWRKFFMIPPVSAFVPGALKPSNEELYYLGKDLDAIQSHFTEVQCPVYLVHAQDDKVIPHIQSERVAKLFINAPTVKMISLPSGGHFFPQTRFYQFRDVLVNALNAEAAYL